MDKKRVNGGSRMLSLCLVLLLTALLAGADDKNKKPASAPPPRAATQVSGPAPQAHTPVQMPHTTYHAPQGGRSTVNKGGTSTVNKGTGNVTPYTGKAPAGRPLGTTAYRPPSGTTNPNQPRVNGAIVKGPVMNPSGSKTPVAGGGHSVSTLARDPFHAPRRTLVNSGNNHFAYDHRGTLREIHRPGMDMHRDLRGDRTFIAERNGRRIVSMGPHRGYMEHAYLRRNGRVYVQRTYVVGGVRYARVYRSYYWHGAAYYHYVPAFYYRPAFYGWAVNPWPARVSWGWGWAGAPWYGFYGYYFAPYPVYPAASFWLTDYLLAENLKLAYAAQQEAAAGAAPEGAPPDAGPAPTTVQLSPEVKQMIADEVQRQLALERDAAGAPVAQPPSPPANGGAPGSAPVETPSALDPNSRVFVVSSNLDVVKEDGSECSLSPGDVIVRNGTAPTDGTKVGVNVVTSKRNDCPAGTNTAVEVSDLQEMQNQFREQLDSGLKALADSQGKDGMPNAPDATTTAGEVPAPAPDSSAESDLQAQNQIADQAEMDAKKSVPQQK